MRICLHWRASTSLRMLTVVVALDELELHQMDSKSAVLHSPVML